MKPGFKVHEGRSEFDATLPRRGVARAPFSPNVFVCTFPSLAAGDGGDPIPCSHLHWPEWGYPPTLVVVDWL